MNTSPFFSSASRLLAPLVAVGALFLVDANAFAADSLPPVIDRYEHLLIRSPGKGTAFDKVYQYFFEGDGLEKLAARWTAQARAGGPDAATYWLLLGVLSERQGKGPEAIKLYQKAADLKPDDAHIWSALGDAQAAGGNMPEAIKALQKALVNHPTPEMRPALYRQLARSQQRAFDTDGALKTWRQFISESPEDPFVIEEAADAMADAERFTDARAQYEKLRDLAGTDPYRRVTAIMKLAQLEEKQGHAEQGRAIYESALPLASPASWMHREVRSRIEESYRRQDDLPGLVKYYEATLEKQGHEVDVALRLSDALLELNRKAEAVKWLRQAGEWAPDRDEVQVSLAKRLGEIDQPREAVTILTKLTTAHPEEESYWEFLGDAHWQVFKLAKEDTEKAAAIKSWGQLAPGGSKDVSMVGRIADILRAHELVPEALAAYERLVQLAPDVPELWQRRAEYLFELKRNDEAAQVLRDMVAGNRATPSNFLRVARLQKRREDFPGALDSVAKGLAKEPANFELLMLQWRLFADTNQWEQAAGLFERLLAAAPSVYSVDQVEDQQVQALHGMNKVDEVSKQLAGRLGQTPPLSESDLRLLLRITLQNDDLDTAGEAIAEAKRRFPTSVPLVRREVEFEKRKGHLDARIAALQHLIELQPKQKIEWLREIVRAYQDEGLWDKALAAAQLVINEAPASADSYVLAADLNFGAQHFDAGIAKLREAIRLSDKPNDLRLRLARTFLDAGRIDEARQTYDAVFEAENDPKVRLSLTRQLAEVYLQQGKLDDLIARFRQRQRAEEGGWRYALYLAEIFQQMQDFAAAREELTKALGARSHDGNFLRQLMNLAEQEGNMPERARFAKLLAEVEPGEAHQIDLADALLDTGETEEALKIIRANEESLVKDPIPWRDVLLKFHSAGAGDNLAEALRQTLERHAGDWRGRLTLAEMLLSLGDTAGAEHWLWDILAMAPEAPPAAPAKPASSSPAAGMAYANGFNVYAMGGAYWGGGFAPYPYPTAGGNNMTKYTQRTSRNYLIRQNLAQIMATRSSQMRRGGNQFGQFGYRRGYAFGGQMLPPAIGSLDEARDYATVYLAVLAEQQNHEEAFLSDLQKRLAGFSRADRIIAYSLIQAPASLRHEIELEAAQASGDSDLDRYCFQVVTGLLQNENRRGTAAGDSNDLALLHSFLQREHNPQELLSDKIAYHGMLEQAGRGDEAKKLADEILAQVDTAGPDVLPVLLGFAVQSSAVDVAEKALSRLLAASQQPGQSVLKQQIGWYRFSLATLLLQKKEPVDRGVHLLADMLEESYAKQLPVAMAAFSPFSRRTFRTAWNQNTQFPYPNRFLDEMRIQTWSQVFQQLKGADALDAMKEQLNHQLQSLPNDQTVYAQLARACFWWWDGKRGDAVGEVIQLAHELKDDDLRMMASTMAAENGDPNGAAQLLEEVTATTGDLGTDKQVRLFMLARAANQLDRAREIALTLTKMRLDANDQMQLVSQLQQLGLKEQADALMKKGTTARMQGQPNRIEFQLSQQMQADHEAESLALARAILARDPLSAGPNGDYPRHQALEALQKFKAIGAYRTELEKQLADAPGSVRTLYLLAESYDQREPARALEYYRKLVELKPTDTNFQLKLATILNNSKQADEAMRIWETQLARDPDAVLQNAFGYMFQAYQNSKQLSRLAAALTALPKPRDSSRSLNMFGGRMDLGQYFNQVATQLQQEGKTREAIAVWRAALNGWSGQGTEQMVLAPLISALIETGDNQGAGTEIEHFLFPETKSKVLFGFDANDNNRSWLVTMSYGDGRVDSPVIAFLRLAAQAGALDHIRTRAVAAADAKKGGEEARVVLLIDAIRRDPAVLDDLAIRARAELQRSTEQHDIQALQMLQALAQELREWPAAKHLALELMVSAGKGVRTAFGRDMGANFSPQAAELAVEIGETNTARELLHDWRSESKRAVSFNGIEFEARMQLPVMDLMARVGMFEEARELLKGVKSNPQLKNDPDTRRRVDDFENRLTLLSGGAGRARLTIWSVPPATGEPVGVVCWELGQAISARRNEETFLSIAGEPMPILDGRYDLEIYHGPTPTAMRKVATLSTVKSRGTWTSPTPLTGGYILALARDKTGVVFSAPSLIIAGPNLLSPLRPDSAPRAAGVSRPAVPGWSGFSVGSVSVANGGPRAGGDYITWQSLNRYNQETAVSKRIPIESGKEYFLSGWLRSRENVGSVQVTGQFFDKDGNSIGQVYTGSGEPDRWYCLQRHLIRTRNPGRGDQVIPDRAVEIEWKIQCNSGCDLDSLYFGEATALPSSPSE